MHKKLLFLAIALSSMFVIVGCFLMFAPTPVHVDKEKDMLIKAIGLLGVLFFGGWLNFSIKKVNERYFLV